MRVKYLLRILLVMGAILLFSSRLQSILVSGNSFLETLRPMIEKPFATYDEKMAMKYPVYYDFIQAVKEITPEDSVLYLPELNIPRPKPMWALGNIQITQPLLYPRKVRKLGLDNFPAKKDDDKATYIIVAYGYPEISVPDSKLIILVDDNKIQPDVYEPLVFKENNIAGLIIVE